MVEGDRDDVPRRPCRALHGRDPHGRRASRPAAGARGALDPPRGPPRRDARRAGVAGRDPDRLPRRRRGRRGDPTRPRHVRGASRDGRRHRGGAGARRRGRGPRAGRAPAGRGLRRARARRGRQLAARQGLRARRLRYATCSSASGAPPSTATTGSGSGSAGSRRSSTRRSSTLLARQGGVATREVVVAAESSAGDALLVLRGDATALDDLAPEAVDDERLRAAWRALARAGAAGIAHMRVDGRTIALVGDEVGLVDFAGSVVAPREDQLLTDRAQLLATTASLAGQDRAVGAALESLGPEGLAALAPYLQPAALPPGLRRSLEAADVEADELRDRVAAAAGVEPPELVKLRRVTWWTPRPGRVARPRDDDRARGARRPRPGRARRHDRGRGVELARARLRRRAAPADHPVALDAWVGARAAAVRPRLRDAARNGLHEPRPALELRADGGQHPLLPAPGRPARGGRHRRRDRLVREHGDPGAAPRRSSCSSRRRASTSSWRRPRATRSSSSPCSPCSPR